MLRCHFKLQIQNNSACEVSIHLAITTLLMICKWYQEIFTFNMFLINSKYPTHLFMYVKLFAVYDANGQM